MTNQQAQPARRIDAIDLARGVALVAMAIYHLAWDLSFFGYLPPGVVEVGGWKVFARCIAGSFLFLVGVSLVLAHGRGIRWRGFWKRFAQVAVAAALITIATLYLFPDAFIFFGILHAIAISSLVGLLFLRMPPLLTLLAAAAVVAASWLLKGIAPDNLAFLWLGLSATARRSNDFVPLFPWAGAVLAGVGVAGLGVRHGLFARLAALRSPRVLRPLAFAGRHGLTFYLLHQPLLIGCVWLATQIYPPARESDDVAFGRSCQAACQDSGRDASFCGYYCGCMLGELRADDALASVMRSTGSPQLTARVQETARICTAETEANAPAP